MVSFTQPPLFSSLVPLNRKKTISFSTQPKKNYFSTFKSSKISSSDSKSSVSQENSPESEPNEDRDPVKLAFAKAKAYRKNKPISNVVPEPPREPYAKATEINDDVSIAVKPALETAKEYKTTNDRSDAVENSGQEFAKMDEKNEGGPKEIPSAIKFAVGRAKEYTESKGFVGDDCGGVGETEKDPIASGGAETSSGNKQWTRNSGKKEELKVSSIDFMGLGFSDKRSGRGLPAGLVPQSDPFPKGDFPEVEILVGDITRFNNDALPASEQIRVQENGADVYEPKVSTWGVFPRPSNISKTFGGGRNIRPGEELETTEERTAKEARTKQLIAAYKSTICLNMDPKLRSECEKALKEGDSLMDLGQLKEALPFYEEVMEKLPFQNELHGLAALQWSICLDSLSRPNEARDMYEKLQSHPSPKVSKKARHLVFGFQAMEMMKVNSLRTSSLSSDYQSYFDAFVQNTKNYPPNEAEVDEAGFNQTLLYVIIMVSPIFLVFLFAASKFR